MQTPTNISPRIAIAALAAAGNQPSIQSLGLAVCSALIDSPASGVSPGSDGLYRIQLLPDGYFGAPDGRPNDVPGGQWLLDDIAWASLKANASQRTNQYVVDYEHQTLYAAESGHAAPASGWIDPSSITYEPGRGLFALARWTPRARDFIQGEEYKFISSVFAYDKMTGRPVKLLHVALTNDPALDGMDAIAALSNRYGHAGQDAHPFLPDTTPKGAHMNEELRALLKTLGIEVEPGDLSDAALTAHCKTANTALAALSAKANKASELETGLAALKAQKTGEVNLSQYVPRQTYDAAVTELAALRAENGVLTIDQVIADAANDGKIMAAETNYLQAFGKQQGVTALKSMLAQRPAIAALKVQQAGDKTPPEPNTGTAALTADEKLVADQLGISHADFLKAKAEENH
ncbi:phage protease [Oceanobacter sp. 4_MG-2023]|uniref:phage protease n=1 Tax=Oceanobacter sp. 4_MG-2023 TaxID=3062623 RepID=UPI002732661B|nr:phage protease [Oceanobacter sp. 4_MG-2023]MDP2548080.1 phage protease [Oceanobacter sp. 4_MG-2023]